MDFMLLVNESKTIGNLRHNRPNFHYSHSRGGGMNKSRCPNAFIILIQIQGTEFHIDKGVRKVWKVPKLQNFDDVLMCAIAQLFHRTLLVPRRSWLLYRQVQQLPCKALFCFRIVKLQVSQ
jgi:hypothetical protein